MRSRTSVQTEDDQLIAGQSARVCRHTPLWITAQERNSHMTGGNFSIGVGSPDIFGSEVWAITWVVCGTAHFFVVVATTTASNSF